MEILVVKNSSRKHISLKGLHVSTLEDSFNLVKKMDDNFKVN